MASDLGRPGANATAGGRAFFWAAIGASVLGIGLAVIQYSLKHLFVPWYVPVLTTLSVVLLLFSLVRHGSIARMVALALVTALAGFEWFFLLSVARLPKYQGPARAGDHVPAFQTTLADGRRFTDRDLQNGRPHVLVFFRGRW